MFHWLWTGLIGLLAGAIAKMLSPGNAPQGILVTMLIGIAGSVTATFIGREIGWYSYGQSAGFFMSVAGAVLLLWIYRKIMDGQRS